jgi:hypothetical protein
MRRKNFVISGLDRDESPDIVHSQGFPLMRTSFPIITFNGANICKPGSTLLEY